MKKLLAIMFVVLLATDAYATMRKPTIKLPAHSDNLGSRISVGNAVSAIEHLMGSTNYDFLLKEYNGDGTYYVSTGDKIHLNNGMTILIRSFEIKNSYDNVLDILYLYLDFFVGDEKISVLPVNVKLNANPAILGWNGYYFKGYGVEMSIPEGNQNPRLDTKMRMFKQSVRLSFASPDVLDVVESPETLFNYCVENEGAGRKPCFRYTPYAPVAGETVRKNDNVSVIGDPADVDWYFSQANACYNVVKNKLGLEPKFKPMPVRFSGDGMLFSTSYDTGILMSDYEDPHDHPSVCSDRYLLHEMAHYFMLPFPLDNIFNEGFATLIEHELDQEPAEITFIQSMELQRGSDSTPIIGSLHRILFTSVIDNSAKFQFETIHYPEEDEAFSSYSSSIKSHNNYATKANADAYPIVHVRELSPDQVVVDLYESAPLYRRLNCRPDGFQMYVGWRGVDGAIMEADESINPIANFSPLDGYLNDGTYSNESYYKSSGCFWREIASEIDLKTLAADIGRYRNFNNEPLDLLNYLNNAGLNTDDLASRFGISFENAGRLPFPLPLYGNTAAY